MQTTSTKIKDFQVGDKFHFYGAIFEVTGKLQTWTNHGGRKDDTITYGRQCKFISLDSGGTDADALLKCYDWMQGIEEVTYAKIVGD